MVRVVVLLVIYGYTHRILTSSGLCAKNVLKNTRSEVMPVSGRPILSWAPFSGASVITAHIKRKAMQRSRVLNIVIKAMIIKNFYL